MKKLKNFYNILICSLLIGVTLSCTNELNVPDTGGNAATLTSPVKKPEMISYSGNQTLYNSFDGTNNVINSRAGDEEEVASGHPYNWGDSEEEFNKLKNIDYSDATKYTGNNQGSDVYYIPEGTYDSGEWQNGLKFNKGSDLTIYITPGAKVRNIGQDLGNVNIIVCPGAEFTIDRINADNCKIYNAGTLNFPNGYDESPIKYIYNEGDIFFGKENDNNGKIWGAQNTIYSKGGTITFYGNYTMINGSIISNNIVQTFGSISLQSSGVRDICKFIARGDITIDGQNDCFGEISGSGDIKPNIKLNGDPITLHHPVGWIHDINTIEFVSDNDGNTIRTYDNNSKALVECNTLKPKKLSSSLNLPNTYLKGEIYLNADKVVFEVDEIKNQNQSVYTGDEISSLNENRANVDPKEFAPACGNEEPIKPDPPTEPTEPEPGTDTPTPSKTQNEVEINFALDDIHDKYDILDLVTKLSLHVRYPHDIEVIIPVPEYIYCDQDDLAILNDHYHGNYTYDGETVTHEMNIGEDEESLSVTLNVEFVPASEDKLTVEGQKGNGGYIRVWTDGINQDVIDYCQDNFGDGINFEIYNYYNHGNMGVPSNYEIGYEELQWRYLSRSFVNFDWQKDLANKIYPAIFVNAFNQLRESDPNYGEVTPPEFNKGDCYLWIMGDERANYNQDTYKPEGYITREGTPNPAIKWSDNEQCAYFHNAYQGPHYNSSDLNWIYTRKEPTKKVMPTENYFPFSDTRPFIIDRIHLQQ